MAAHKYLWCWQHDSMTPISGVTYPACHISPIKTTESRISLGITTPALWQFVTRAGMEMVSASDISGEVYFDEESSTANISRMSRMSPESIFTNQDLVAIFGKHLNCNQHHKIKTWFVCYFRWSNLLLGRHNLSWNAIYVCPDDKKLFDEKLLQKQIWWMTNKLKTKVYAFNFCIPVLNIYWQLYISNQYWRAFARKCCLVDCIDWLLTYPSRLHQVPCLRMLNIWKVKSWIWETSYWGVLCTIVKLT